ncbi:MAG: aspartate aminotransferase family protein [Bacteroidales bacterium]|nr:aspartate aminotransferase family protein [Lentimicrobiaceae bacterium]MDD5694546.1 aspartate aminotransferase family protein [Bacteroidales bacterium]
MLIQRELFFRHIGLPSRKPLALEIERAEGIFLYDIDGKRYVDLVSGISVSNIGHRHPVVVKAIEEQLDKYMHLMVYGKYIQSPQVRLATRLAGMLPGSLQTCFFVNSGSEAIEGAMKLAKRYTGRTEIIAFKNAYHGGTQGALSILGHETLKNAFRPLLPDIRLLTFNSFTDLNDLSERTACVVVEPIQAEAGIILPAPGFLQALREKCNQTGALLVYDEIQMAFGRTGKLFCLEHEQVVPDILCLAKSMGGGMPLGAFISSQEIMGSLAYDPELGHITTFGGHPVCCAAALASLEVLTSGALVLQAQPKGELFYQLLKDHPLIKEIRFRGLMMAVELENEEITNKLVHLLAENGLIVDQFLFRPNSFRIAPPLIIEDNQIREVCRIILMVLGNFLSKEGNI